jgi:SAM-dependent methyltransferase
MLEAASLKPGEQVLELACGAGRVGLQTSELVGAEGRVVCSDFAQEMVDAVSGLADRLGRDNVEARVLDALNPELGDERFDVVLCRFGYMLMSDPGQALANSRDALKPGGRLVLAVWGRGEENPWLMTIFDAVMGHLGAPPPEPGTPGPFALGDPEHVKSLLEQAEFSDVSVASIEARQSYDSVDSWWAEIRDVSGPLAALLASLPDDDQLAIRERATENARTFLTSDGGLEFPASVVGGQAMK